METLDLTVDHGVENAREIERMTADHPGEEATLFMRGRVLGGLQPTRAFGDARYKYDKETLEKMVLMEGNTNKRRVPRNYKTPPYVNFTELIG
jgi:pyruvate dehydrogenase phosphatase